MARARLLFLLSGALLMVACGTGRRRGYASEEDGVRICPAGETVPGIDVSHWDGTVNWNQVAAAGYKFAFAKATEGVNTVDNTFATNWAGIKAAGMYRGAYHFFHGTQSGVDQADAFLNQVGQLGQPGDLPPVLDWEDGSGTCNSTTIQAAVDFLNRVKQRTGVTPMIYTAAGYWSTCSSTSQFASYQLWVANYVALSTCPTTPTTWSRWTIWQYSDNGRVSGIDPNTAVDLNVFNGSFAELSALAGMTTSMQTASIAQVSGNEAMTMVNWPDGRASLFGRSPSAQAQVVTTSGANDTWSAVTPIDSGALCGSAAAFWGGSWNYPELFSPLSGGGSGHLWWLSSGSWRSYQTFGGTGLSSFATAVGKDGRTFVFALGSDRAIWANSWNTANTAWTGWSSLGGNFATGAAAITWGNGTIELFATDAAGVVWHSWLLSSATTWAAWEVLGGGMASRPVAVRWSDGSAGHAEVFARGTDGKLYHSNYSYQTDWPAFSVISAGTTIQGEPSAVMNPTTGPEVFARDSSDYVVHLKWNGSAYGSFNRIGTQVVASDPFGWTRKDGTTQVFAIDSAGRLASARETNGGWSEWSNLGGNFDPCVPEPPVEMDGGMPDAGVSMDAGSPTLDAGLLFDAGQPVDAGIAVDAGVFVDAGQPVDAGISIDAGTPDLDAGSQPFADAGLASSGDAGAQQVPSTKSGGCHCSTGTNPDLFGGLMLGLLQFARRAGRRSA